MLTKKFNCFGYTWCDCLSRTLSLRIAKHGYTLLLVLYIITELVHQLGGWTLHLAPFGQFLQFVAVDVSSGWLILRTRYRAKPVPDSCERAKGEDGGVELDTHHG